MHRLHLARAEERRGWAGREEGARAQKKCFIGRCLEGDTHSAAVQQGGEILIKVFFPPSMQLLTAAGLGLLLARVCVCVCPCICACVCVFIVASESVERRV